MEIQPGKGKDGADIVTLTEREAVNLVEAIVHALIAPDRWGGDRGVFRVMISD